MPDDTLSRKEKKNISTSFFLALVCQEIESKL